jgi:hypothetical protein
MGNDLYIYIYTYVNVVDTVVVGLGFTQPPPGVDMQICLPTAATIPPQAWFNAGFHDTIWENRTE